MSGDSISVHEALQGPVSRDMAVDGSVKPMVLSGCATDGLFYDACVLVRGR